MKGHIFDFYDGKVISVYLFGAACFPNCNNYALTKIAVNNTDSYGKDAIDLVMQNLYVDDLLKSMSGGALV